VRRSGHVLGQCDNLRLHRDDDVDDGRVNSARSRAVVQIPAYQPQGPTLCAIRRTVRIQSSKGIAGTSAGRCMNG
jgi:hypothetical protein